MTVQRRMVFALVYLAVLLVGGTLGYVLIEDWPVFLGFYQTVTTIATVGFGEMRPLSTAGRAFTLVLIFAGVGGAAYTFSTAVQLAIEGQFGVYFGRRRMAHHIAALRDHYIVCGFGRVGQGIAHELHQRQAPFIVVESDAAVIDELERLGYVHIHGDATRDEVLRTAGVERAAGLMAASGQDTANTYIALAARSFNAGLHIVARASHPDSVDKLRRAGADRVVSPYDVAGRHMAIAGLHPAMVDFLTTDFHHPDGDVILAQVTVAGGSGLAGRTLADVLAGRRGTTVLGLRRPDGKLDTEPEPGEVLRAGDQVLLIGPSRQVEAIAGRERRSDARIPARRSARSEQDSGGT